MKTLSLIGIVILFVLITSTCSAELIIVPDSYSSITAACQVAVNGDTVAVREGEYYEDIVTINSGVTLIGLGADPTLVRILPSTTHAPIRTYSGADPIFIENVEIRGTRWSGVVNNHNDGLIIQDCKLIVYGEGGFYTSYFSLSANIEVRKCTIILDGGTPELFALNGATDVLFEDCVIYIAQGFGVYNLPRGSTLILRNNTFLTEVLVSGSSSTDYSLIAVNNIMPEVYCYTYLGDLPDVLEWRFNDFVIVPPDVGCGYQVGNISADPLFCEAPPYPPNGDYRLDPESPCIDTGEEGEDIGARLGLCLPFSCADDTQDFNLGGISIDSVMPNPSFGNIHIKAFAPSKSTGIIDILDINGRVVWSDNWQSNEQQIIVSWDGRSDGGTMVQAGLYYIRLSNKNDTVTHRVCILK